MSDKDLFLKALATVGGRKGDLAEKCGVSRQTVTAWSRGNLTDYARVKLIAATNGEATNA